MNQNKQVESGRTMVEMLGVLAIMGVISMAMITAYNVAFMRFRMNNLMYEISLRTISYVHQMELAPLAPGSILYSGEFGSVTNGGYPVKARVTNNPNHFEVIVEGVPTDICEQVLRLYTHPLSMRVKNGGVEKGYDRADENISICGTKKTTDEMIFVFSKMFERN